MNTTTQRELGDLTPIRSVMEWLEEQTRSIAAPPESVRLITEIRRRLGDAIADAERPTLPVEGVSVDEYAALRGLSPAAVYKRIQRDKLRALRTPDGLRIPLEPLTA